MFSSCWVESSKRDLINPDGEKLLGNLSNVIMYPSETMRQGSLGCEATENLCLRRSCSESEEPRDWLESRQQEWCCLKQKYIKNQEATIICNNHEQNNFRTCNTMQYTIQINPFRILGKCLPFCRMSTLDKTIHACKMLVFYCNHNFFQFK